MDRSEIESKLTFLKQYYNPTKANFQRLDSLVKNNSSYEEIITTLNDLKELPRTPKNVGEFIENLLTECLELTARQTALVIKKKEYSNLHATSIVEYIRRAKDYSDEQNKFSISISYTEEDNQIIRLEFASSEKNEILPVEITYTNKDLFENEVLFQIIETYFENNTTNNYDFSNSDTIVTSNIKTSLTIINPTEKIYEKIYSYINAIRQNDIYPEVISNKESAIGNLFIISIVFLLIIILTAVCILFYRISS